MDLVVNYGVPDEVLTDEEISFTSALLGELYQFIQINFGDRLVQ